MRAWTSVVVALALVAPVRAGDAKSRVVFDFWESAYLEGGRSGYAHTLVEQIDSGGKMSFRTTVTLKLKVKRFETAIDRSEEHTSELQSLRHLVCRLLL